MAYLIGLVMGVIIGGVVAVGAQQYYPEQPLGWSPTPQQRFQQQQSQQLFDAYLRQQLQRGPERDPC